MGTPAQEIETIMIGGLPIHKATRAALAQAFVRDWEGRYDPDRKPRFSTSANGHVLALAARNEKFRALLTSADHIDADGMPLVIASRYWAKEALPERIATTDFIHDVARAVRGHPVRFFLLGADRQTNAAAQVKLRSAYPWLIVEGQHGYFDAESESEIVSTIRDFKPDLLWVGLGVPREHLFVERHRQDTV